MAAKIISDNKLDQDIAKYKRDFEALNRAAQAFMTSFAQIKPTDRAKTLLKLQTAMKSIQRFLTTPQQYELTNAGTRFGLDSLRSSFTSFLGRWSKFEKTIG